MGLKGPCCAAASLGHLRRIMWLNRPVNSGHKRREESFSPLHNAPNEVAGGSVIPGWALCSLFTICLMTERGLPSAPVLPNEPQREITGSIVARHRSLALIRPNKPVSSQGRTHPSTASQEPHTAHSFSPSLYHYDIRVTWPYHPLKHNLHSLSLLFIFTCWDRNNKPFFSLGHCCCVYCSADNVWVCICIHTGCLLARPFASILNRAAPLGLWYLPELLPNVCKWACPQWCPQLHAVGQRQRTRRPSLSSITPDPLSVTRHVHPNNGPRQRTMSSPISDTHSLQLFSIHTDEPLAWLLGALDEVSRICSDILHRDSHTSTLSRWLLNLC